MAVDFDASVVEQYATRASYVDDGHFNDGDRMYIYRQYQIENSITFDETDEGKSYRVYAYDYYHNAKQLWGVLVGKKGYEEAASFTQAAKDSMVWDNARTVRFRSFVRSNYAGCISAGRGAYYPDYCISNWVSSGGPTLNVPLELKHLGSRIVLTPRNNGTELSSVEICLDWHDYKRSDNNDTNTHDNEETGITDALAQERAEAVAAVYNRMCMPSGVDIKNEVLYAMPKAYYEAHPSSLEDVETEDHDAEGANFAHYQNNTLSAEQVTNLVQRAVFNHLNGNCYLITIPYDISTDNQGEILVLPSFTRFKVRLRDVNNGDVGTAPGTESEYHIFCLSDIMNGASPKYPNGLEMRPGRSYRFSVGYRYQNITITDASDLSWDEQTAVDESSPVDATAIPDNIYDWWSTVMNTAAKNALSDGTFNPDFQLDSQAKFLSFIKLVNGTASTKNGTELKHAYTITKQFSGDDTNQKVEGWYDEAQTLPGVDTMWVRKKLDNEPGHVWNDPSFDFSDYIFFDRFYPQNGDVPAHVIEEYIHEPFSFYDNLTSQTLTVSLTGDLDLSDWFIDPIGNSDSNPFEGNFDGGIFTLKNVNVNGGYLFGYINNSIVRNLSVVSTHKTALVNYAKGTNYVAGISIDANAAGASVLNEITSGTTNIVGCIHQGTSTAGMVGTAIGKISMYGCMEAGTILPEGTFAGAALCGTDATGSLSPQMPLDKNVVWGKFMCNYYDKTHNPKAHAVGTAADNYRVGEYIRGYKSSILKAHVDNRLSAKNAYNPNYYGNAPYKAMNAAIYHYNKHVEKENQKCLVHFEVTNTTFDYLYPQLVTGEPGDEYNIDIPSEKS